MVGTGLPLSKPVGNPRNYKHGHTKKNADGSIWTSRTYRTWHGMHGRCRHLGNASYEDYGGRGITVCERWGTFAKFLEDMGVRPEGMTLDRIDPNGNYEPSNCRWATWSQQNQNKRKRR